MTIDGGRTLGFELASDMAAPAGPEAETCLLFIQVGGGALASSTVQALAEAADLGVLAGRPPLYPVQSEGCAPLDRAFRLVRQLDDPLTAITNTDDSDFMWPWDDPSSLATGILDDIVYDWQPIVATMLEDGSSPVVATEAEVAEAHRLIRDHTEVPADPTGTAGLAGLLAARRQGMVGDDDTVMVLLTGVER
jgi:Threonine synthase